ncbi:MAG TPA: NlpC/P60 family protein [Chitinophagales bacterium]|jgi:hypothetical protein|nr:C40 family peptidase [Chitinophagales bacterium]MBP6154076.1 C40 family peptidase [Chitinophagales bacterium]HQV78522.1 NlpC/P60 family protein [Chitinophagales bacterium]HQW78792.1 NlpC/P60 family protein [Chitinophagales bacterium]HRB66666.1 NlpC/P60 family protein [Chitinophagales bacterium]
MKGKVILSAIPMRLEANDKAEMVNQVLFGETFDVLTKEDKWSKIKLHHDKYVGWIDNKQYQIIDKKTEEIKLKNVISKVIEKKKNIFLPMGSIVDFEIKKTNHSLLQTAKSFLNTPYLWGGRCFLGIDCSGFIQIIFRVHHVALQRDAYQQQTQGKRVKFDLIATNDLVFFQNDAGKIIHVGLAFKEKNKLKIIHASGKVRIDLLDERGIFNEETQHYSHIFHSIKRII